MRKSLENPDTVEIVVASIDDPESMKSMAAQTKVIIATAGPFDKIGLPVLFNVNIVALSTKRVLHITFACCR